jgi:hypothetical protein
MRGSILRGMDRANSGLRVGVAALLVGAAAARIAVYYCCSAPFEDNYITLRYSRNIAGGLGFVYNPGEHVLAASSPLWTLLNALYIWLFGAGTVIGFEFWLSLVLDLAAIIAIATVLSRAGLAPAVSWSALLPMAFFSPFVIITSSGMETSLFSALLAFSILGLQSGNLVVSFACAGLLAICRPEGFPWLGLLLVLVVLTERRVPWKEGLVAAGFVAPWMTYAKLRFGGVVPQSALAKAPWTYAPITHVLGAGFGWLPKTLFTLTFIHSLPRPGVLNTMWMKSTPELAALGLFLLGALVAVRRRGTREMVLFFMVLVCFYSFAAPGVSYFWYGVTPSMLFYPVLMLGLWRVCSFIADRFPSLTQGAPQKAWGVACLLLLAALIPGLVVRAHNLKDARQYQPNTLEAVGLFLDHKTPKEATVMLEPIGYVGYFSGRYIYDLGGLVTPSITRLRQDFPRDWDIRAIFSFSPDYLLLRDFEIPQNVDFVRGGQRLFESDQQRADFFSRYREIGKYEGMFVYGNQLPGYVLFRRSNGVQTAMSAPGVTAEAVHGILRAGGQADSDLTQGMSH